MATKPATSADILYHLRGDDDITFLSGRLPLSDIGHLAKQTAETERINVNVWLWSPTAGMVWLAAYSTK